MADSDDIDRLRAAASGMDDLFDIALPDAPGMTFVGGRFCVRASSGEEVMFSAGAADEDRQRAFRRCVGEVVETQAQFLSDRHAVRLMTAEGAWGGQLGAEERATLLELADTAGEGSPWLPSVRLADGQPTCVPAVLCLRDVPGFRSSASSLGCAAGPTLGDATASALLELVERDALALWWRGGAEAAAIEPAAIPAANALLSLARLEAPARATRFIDISSDIGIPVVAAISFDAVGRSLAAGFACRTALDTAACAALRELVQMELGNRLVAMKLDRGGEGALSEGERRQLERMRELSADDPRLLPAAISRPAARRVAGDASAIAARLGDAGIHCHRVDLTPAEGAIPVVKVVAPQLQAEPGHHLTRRLERLRELRGFRAGDVPTVGLI
jgi:ribosomal protein S12 methylthiotransferase accessory factor